MKCLICNKSRQVNFLDHYKLETQEDLNFFNDAKVFFKTFFWTVSSIVECSLDMREVVGA